MRLFHFMPCAVILLAVSGAAPGAFAASATLEGEAQRLGNGSVHT